MMWTWFSQDGHTNGAPFPRARMGGDMRQASLSDITGATLIRYESAGTAINIDGTEADNRIGHGGVSFRAMPGHITGDMVIAYLYHVLRIDPHRFVFDLPSTCLGTGSTRTGIGGAKGGNREGYVFRRGPDGKATGNPVGKIYFLSGDRKFSERDPEDRRDFERLS